MERRATQNRLTTLHARSSFENQQGSVGKNTRVAPLAPVKVGLAVEQQASTEQARRCNISTATVSLASRSRDSVKQKNLISLRKICRCGQRPSVSCQHAAEECRAHQFFELRYRTRGSVAQTREGGRKEVLRWTGSVPPPPTAPTPAYFGTHGNTAYTKLFKHIHRTGDTWWTRRGKTLFLWDTIGDLTPSHG